MVTFAQTVAMPSTSDYGPPTPDIFSQVANLPNSYYQGQFNRQQRDMNDVRLQQSQRVADLQKQMGSLDWKDPAVYSKAATLIAAMGQPAEAAALLQQAPQPQSPMLSGGGQPGAPGAGGAAPAGGGAPVAAGPRVPVQAGVQGDSGSGTIASMVTDRLPNQDATTGQTIAKIASALGVDANAQLTPGQIRRVQGLLQNPKYTPTPSSPSGESGGGPSNRLSTSSAGQDAPATPSQRVAGAFGALPPSANAGTPAAQPAPQGGPQPAPIGAPPARPAAAPVAQPQPQPALPQGHPIVPQVPLPPGYKDPQAAITALRAEAAGLARYPREKGQVEALNHWADRIEESLKPVQANPNTIMLDPRTGQVLYEGPAAASLRATEQAGGSPTLDADAERYRQTGQLPPNLAKNLTGQAEARAIRQRATQLEQEAGGDPTEWSKKWQQNKAAQVAIQRFTSGPQGNTIRSFNVLVDHLDTLDEAAAALKNGDNRMLNRFKQTWAANTGGTAPTNFDGVKALVGDEIVKAVVGSAGALADREEVKKDLDRASSPAQLAELVGKYKKLALGQLHGLQKQYETSTGLKNFGEMLLPGTLKALGGATEEKKSDTTVSKDGWTVVTAPNGKKARIQEITE